MSQGTLTLLQVKFVGNGPCGGSPIEFRVGSNSIGSAQINQINQYVSFPPSASGVVDGICSIKAYQGGALRAQFAPGINAGNSLPNGQGQAVTACFGGGQLFLNYTITPLP